MKSYFPESRLLSSDQRLLCLPIRQDKVPYLRRAHLLVYAINRQAIPDNPLTLFKTLPIEKEIKPNDNDILNIPSEYNIYLLKEKEFGLPISIPAYIIEDVIIFAKNININNRKS